MPWATPMAWSHRSKCTAVVSARSTSPHMCSVELMSPGSISRVAIRLQAPPSAVTLTASTECPLVAYVSTHSGNGAILRNTLPGTSALFLRDTEPLDVSAPPGLTGQVSPPDAVQAASHTEETARASSQDAEQPGSQTPQQKADSTALSLSPIGPRQSTALPLPLVHRTTIQEILERSHWHDLLQSSELQTELLHHCPFCRQWCMDTAAIKRHMMQQHAESPRARDIPRGRAKEAKGRIATPGPGVDWDNQDWGQSWCQNRSSDMSDLVNRMSQLLIKHEYAINSLKQDSTVYFFVQPGPQGLLPILFNTSEKWNQVQHETPEQTEESLRLVLLKALLIELGQRLKNSQNNEEAMQAAQEMGWITAEGRWKTLVWNLQTAALEEVPNGPNGKTWATETIIAEAVELRKLIDPETVFRQGPLQSSSSILGAVGLRAQCSWEGGSRLGNRPVMDRLRCLSYAGLPSPPGEGRPVATGLLSAMVGSLGPAGHAAVLQSLLWPMWMDPDRQCYAPGLIKHLWRRAAQAPNTALHLRGDLFWMPMAAKWQFVQAVHPMILLRSLLSAFSDSLDTGEWGMHLQTFDLAFEGLTLLACHADTAMRTGNTVITAGACGCLGTLHRKAQIAWLC